LLPCSYWIRASWATNLLPWSELGDKLVALVRVEWQTCLPTNAKLGLKDWAISEIPHVEIRSFLFFCPTINSCHTAQFH
jgi:hypothetical protein